MQCIVYLLCQLFADAGHTCEIVHPCPTDFLQAAKVGEDGLAPFRSQAFDVFQYGAIAFFAPPRTMPGNRETMRLVANLLNKV